MFEFQFEPAGNIIIDKKDYRCNVCGREDIVLPDDIRMDGKSIPQDIDLFKSKNFTNQLFATEKFRDVVIKNNFTNIVFNEIKVV